MDFIIAFIVAAVISFWGSLQLGLVNVAVIDTTLTKGGKFALLLAIGGVLPEIPYTLFAIHGAEYLSRLQEHQEKLGIIIGTIMLLLGLYYFFKKSKEIGKETSTTKYAKTGAFSKGLVLAMLNPQLIFFWSGILILLETGSFNIFDHKDKLINFSADDLISPKWSFAFGAATGALCILIIYIFLARRYRNKISTALSTKLNKLVGLFFILIGIVSIVKNII